MQEAISLNWTEQYWNQVERNIGYIKLREQELLRTTPIAVLGVGGLGGPLAEQLVRSGCERLVICDDDIFESSNLNRQVCTRNDLGKLKVEVLKEYLKAINPHVAIRSYYEVTEENIAEILEGVQIVALTLDDTITSILIARTCQKREIPMLESWAVPYICSWWFTPNSVDYETCYGMDTHNLTIEQMRTSKEIQTKVIEALIPKVLQFPGFRSTLDRENGTLQRMISGQISLRSLAPIVRLTASYLAFEVIYAGILTVKEKNLAPNVIGYDYLRMRQITLKI